MLATVKGRIGRAFMHILLVYCSARIAGRYTIHRCHACRIVHDSLVPVLELGLHCGFVLRVCPWFTPVVTHVSQYSFLRSGQTLAVEELPEITRLWRCSSSTRH